MADAAHSGPRPRGGLRGGTALWGLLTLVLLVAVSLPWMHHTFHTIHALTPAASAADSSSTAHSVLHLDHAEWPSQETLLGISVPVDDAVEEPVRALQPLSHSHRCRNPNSFASLGWRSAVWCANGPHRPNPAIHSRRHRYYAFAAT